MRQLAAAMRIQLCGPFVVERDGRDLAASLHGRQPRRLLAYLVVHRGQPVRRAELIDAVWGDDLPRSPEASLSSLLTGLRRALGPEALSGRAALVLRLPPDTRVDTEEARHTATEAEAALATGNAHAALDHARAVLALTARPLLAELDGDWVEKLRRGIEQLRSDQLEIASRAALALGGPFLSSAERYARVLIESEPYRESGYALVMEAMASAGNVAEALRAYEEMRTLLATELGVPPSPALSAVHQRLLASSHTTRRRPSAPKHPAGQPRPPLPALMTRSERRSFVGRESELARLHARWEQARQGQGELVLLTGEPGIGKTRLTARFAAEAHRAGAVVLYGRADEDTVVPYQPFAEGLRDLAEHLNVDALEEAVGPAATELQSLLPELRRAPNGGHGDVADREDRRYALFEGVCALLDHVARLGPLLVVVEDVHWADKATLLLLRHVVRHAEGARVMVLATYRDVELTPAAPLSRLVADLRREHIVHRISLAGFDERDTAALAEAHGEAALRAEWVGRLRDYTAGNPFFIEETLRSVTDAPFDRAPDTGAPDIPESVAELIRRRCLQLSATTVEVLTCASVLGSDFPLAVLERLVERPGDEVLCCLEEAMEAGLVQEHSERLGDFSFCHALVRETIYGWPTGSRRQRLHLRAGEALEAAAADVEVRPAELAHHFFLARRGSGATRAIRYAVAAAREAEGAHAYDEAVSYYERALEALDVAREADPKQRVEMLLGLGAVRWRGGEPGARDAYERAAELARRRSDARALVAAALGAGGRFYAPGRSDPRYTALLEEALEVVAPAEAPVRVRLLARLAEALASGADGERAAAVSGEAVAMARVTGDDAALAAALHARHAALLHVRHLDERLTVGTEMVSLADALELRESAALGRHWLIYDLMEAGDLEGARGRHAELERLARELEQPLYRHSALAWRGMWAQLSGHFAEAERLAREGLRLAERARAPDAHAHFTAQLIAVRREQGRLGELVPTVGRLAMRGSEALPWRALLPLAYLEAGRRDEAEGRLADIASAGGPAASGLFWLTATAWVGEAVAGLGDARASAAILDELEPYSGRVVQAGFSGCWGAVDRVLGLLAGAAGAGDVAERYFVRAIARHAALGAGPLLGRTRRDAARVAR